MPIVPIEQNRVGIAEVQGAKFRTPDLRGTGGEGLADALGVVGKAVGQYAADQDAIQDHADKMYARDLALEYKKEGMRRVGEFSSLQGRAAMDSGVATQQGLVDFGKELTSRAGNPRAQRYLRELIAEPEIDFTGRITDHTRKQQFAFSDNTYQSEAALAQQEAALNFGEPEKQAKSIADGLGALDRRAKLNGWDDATAQTERLKFTSGVHETAINQMLTAPDGGIDQALGYFKAHEGQMTVAARNKVLSAFSEPLTKRQAEADFWEAATGATTEVGERQQVELPNGTFRVPVAGRVTNTFAQHQARGSAGLDIAAPVGSAVKPMAGGTAKVGEDPRSGKFVIVTHPDGTTSSYSHLGNVSIKNGAVVGPDSVIGTVGMTGKTTGPHLHLRVKDKSGKDIDPQSVMGAEAKGGSIIAGQAARNWDQGAVLAAIDKRTDWTPERREAARSFARSRMSQDESALSDRYQDAGREAAKVIADLGEGFTSTAQIPASIRAQMDPVDLAKLDNDLRKDRAAAAEKRANEQQGIYATQLDLMRQFRPEQFKKLDPLAQVGKLSPSQYNSFMTGWLKANQPVDFVEEELRGKVNSEISFQEQHGGVKLGDKEKVALHDYMMGQLRTIHTARGQGQIGAKEVAESFRTGMRTVQVPGRFFGTSEKPTFEVLSDVPAEFETKFRQAWTGAQPPTRSQIIAAYQRSFNRGN